MAIKKFEAPETTKTTFVNVRGEDKKRGQLHVFLFPNGEMILETKRGECIYLTRRQAVDLYTFFDAPRVKKRMLDVLRAHLWAAGGVCREFIQLIDKTPPRATETAPLGAGQPAA